MSQKKEDSLWEKILLIVITALIGGTAPWWWDKVFPSNRNLTSPTTEQSRIIGPNPTPTPIPTPTPKRLDTPQQKCIGLRYLYLPNFSIFKDQPPYNAGVVLYVRPNYSADKAGLQKGDAVLSVNGQELNAKGDIERIIANLKVGDVAKVRAIHPASSTIDPTQVFIYPPFQDKIFNVKVSECYPR